MINTQTVLCLLVLILLCVIIYCHMVRRDTFSSRKQQMAEKMVENKELFEDMGSFREAQRAIPGLDTVQYYDAVNLRGSDFNVKNLLNTI